MPAKKATPPKTAAERVRALRRRRAEAGSAELRGVFVPKELHHEAKRMIAAWLKRLREYH